MRLLIFAVRDSKAEAFMQPWFSQTKGAAIRAFADAVNGEKETAIGKHPDDFTLFYVGEFDDQTGEVIGLAAGNVNLGLASTFVQEAR